MAENTSILDRLKNLFGGQSKSLVGAGAEGSWRGPFNGIGELGGVFPMNALEDGWQRYLDVPTARGVAPVYACVSLYARALSQCTPNHEKDLPKTGVETVTTSACAAVLRKPNSYETWPQIIYNTVMEMLYEGECVWLAARDARGAIAEVHRIGRRMWTVQIEPETHSIFYSISTNNLVDDPEYAVPARDVCHFRQYTPRHPLIGESAIKAAALAIGINVALNSSQMAFYTNMSRPSGVLTTEEKLNQNNIDRLKAAWEQASAALAQGKVPVLSNGLKYESVGIKPIDAQLVDQQKLSALDIARVFGVPYALISDDAGTAGTEALISHWLSIGLGSVIETIERSLERLFNLGASDHVSLDPRPLLRVDFKGRIEGLSRSVQSGILTINEARDSEGYGPVANGDSPVVQQQMVPLDLISQLHAATINSETQTPALPAPTDEEETEPEPKEADPEITKALVASMINSKRKAA